MAAKQPGWSKDLLAPVETVDTDAARLRMLAHMVVEAEAHLDATRARRDAAAARLRARGVAMVDIARWARVSDSYLTRRLLHLGASRRTGRAMPRRLPPAS